MKKLPSEKDVRCPVAKTVDIIGNKWKARCICVLSNLGTLRYGEIKEGMSNISDPTLAQTLKDLVRVGVVERCEYDEMPPRVEYSLTERGKELVPIIRAMKEWSNGFRVENEDEMPRCKGCDFTCE